MSTKNHEQPKMIDGAINLEITEGVDRFDDVFQINNPTKATSFDQDGTQFNFYTENGFHLKIEAFSPSIWRFRYAFNEPFEEGPSYSLDTTTTFSGESLKCTATATTFNLSGSVLKATIQKKDLSIAIFDAKDGQLICEDAAPFYSRSTILKGKVAIKISKCIQPNEAYFGLGDKSGKLNLKGQQLENWCTDAFGFSAESDPLYRSIPFYYGLQNGKAYGIFLHNSYKSFFDFGASDPTICSFSATGGEMDYFFIYGPELLDVAHHYHDLTGKPELPPLWALGFHQCRWSYYPESRVKELADNFRKQQIPCDAIYLDIDYMDGYRCFTWNKDYFPDPAALINSIREQGFHTVVMIDPGIRVDKDYKIYTSGMEEDAFCRRTTGEIMQGPVWPPNCVFPDYTSEKVRNWWGKLYEELYNKDGVSGFWNDMNEPALFKVHLKTFPDEVMHDCDGHPATHKKVHNIYGLLMSKATTEGLKTLQPEKRPFLLSRASFSGGQRYAALWTGDNFSTWEHLRLANIQCQRMSISGFSFNGTDIGGFAGEPDGELMVRWLQLGAFHPVYRVHSMGNKATGDAAVDDDSIKEAEELNRLDQEPWSFGEPYTSQARKAIELRYQLLPYHYTAFWQHAQKGTPVLKSLSFFDQHDPIAVNRELEFIYGEQLLVAPVLKARQKSMTIYLPKGKWLNYFSGKIYEGAKKHRIRVSAQNIPIFVKAGSLIPHYPVQQYTSQLELEEVVLKYYFGADDTSLLYEDAGEGYTYKNGAYRLAQFETSCTADSIQIKQGCEGLFKITYKHYKLELFGLPFSPVTCEVDGEVLTVIQNKNGLFTVDIPANFKNLLLK